MFENNYKSAIEKVTPTEAWKSATLAKMKSAQVAAEAQPKHSGKNIHVSKGFFSTGAKKNIIAAAAIAIIAVPTMLVVLTLQAPMMSDSTQAEAVPEAIADEAAPVEYATEETEEFSVEFESGDAQAAPTPEEAAPELHKDDAELFAAPASDGAGNNETTATEGTLNESEGETTGIEERIAAEQIVMSGTITEINDTYFILLSGTGEEYVCMYTGGTQWEFTGDALLQDVEIICELNEQGEYTTLNVALSKS